MITREFDLMLYQEGNLLFINANQYDSGEQWIFTLYEENGVKYTPATGAIVGVKSDGKGIINTGTVDEYGRVVINETQQMTAAAGLATFELLIDNDTHGTANFKVDVEPRPADNADLSDSDLSLIQEAVDSAAVIVEVIGDSDPSEVIGEHVDDWLDAHPEATTTVQDGAITAPKLNNSLWDKLLVSEEASGAVASFDDGADDVPVSSLKVALEPVQLGSGDPSPTNIRPISGHSSVTVQRTGKNLLGGLALGQSVVEAVNNSTYSTFGSDANGDYVTIKASAATNNIAFSEAVRFKENTQYTLILRLTRNTVGNLNSNINVQYTDGTTDAINFTAQTETDVVVRVFVTTANKTVKAIRTMFGGGTTKLYYDECGIFEGVLTEADFEPYIGTSYPYNLGQSVYGGTVDLATGVLTVTHGIVTDFSALASNGTSSTGAYRYKLEVAGVAGFTVGEAMCNMLKFKAGFNDDAGEFYNGANVFNIFLADSTVASAITTLTGCQIVYPLATPTTVQLTPQEVKTLLGYNNISSTGTVDVIYHADTKLYVDKMTNVDNAIIAPTEVDFVATRNYTTNDLVIVNDTLYKVTSNIATGSAITPNSNVQQTTLSALIKALS